MAVISLVKVEEALDLFQQMIETAGIDLANTHPKTIWPIFKEFTQIPADCIEEAVSFQCGMLDPLGDETVFCLDFVRQFTIEIDDEYDHTEQLHCEFEDAVTDRLENQETEVWSYEFNSLEEFFQMVEASEEFQAITVHSSWTLELYQETV